MHVETSRIQEAAMSLKEGKLVAFPTETVYGLGGNALSEAAVARIYDAKGRPSFNPLIVHVRSLGEAEQYGIFSPQAKALAARFWPGPLTLVVPRRAGCGLSLLASAGLDSIALRVPAHPVARQLLEAAGVPVAAPSANRSGRVSPTEAAHVKSEFPGDEVLVLDGGACQVGIESTVVDVTEETPVILRPGAVTEAMLKEVVVLKQYQAGGAHKSPGMLEKHYSPSKPLRLNATGVEAGEGLLAFGNPFKGHVVENLSANRNLTEAAANLFAMLRKLDAADVPSIAVMPIPEEGLGVAINDRLRRAAAK